MEKQTMNLWIRCGCRSKRKREMNILKREIEIIFNAIKFRFIPSDKFFNRQVERLFFFLCWFYLVFFLFSSTSFD